MTAPSPFLDWPEQKPRCILDTDTFNEIDDQFALVYTLLARDRLDLRAVHAAPFHNERSTGPGDGMHKSIEEIERVFTALGVDDVPVRAGSTRWLEGASEHESSPATEDLISLARESDDPLYVLTIGAPTNVANALLLAPEIRSKVVVLWLGGHPYYWHATGEFNLRQDLAASRLLFEPDVNLVRFPCVNVAAHLRITLPELEACARGNGPVGDYLYHIYADFERIDLKKPFASKVIWDMAPVAWLIDSAFVDTWLIPAPILTSEMTWSLDPRRHLTREAYSLKRDRIFEDFFSRFPDS